jgi:hypothetical protein
MKKKFMQSIICIGLLLSTFSTVGIPSASAQPPAEPGQPTPAPSSSGVTIFIELRWVNNESGLTYDVYFGVENPPPLVVANQSGTTYRPSTRLLLNTTYYWQIVAHNDEQLTNQSPVWLFTTADNSPPFRPVILDGPPEAGRGIDLEFATVAPDPEGDKVFYQWDWGDGNYSDWLGPYTFGEQTKTTHQWAENGTYNIRVRAQDELGKQGEWSSAFNITISPQIHFMNLNPGFLYLIFFTFDKTYGYIYALDVLGMALVISTGGLTVNATGADSVRTVIFEMANRFLTDEQWNVTSNNITGNSFKGLFVPNNGLYEVTARAYDEDGRLVDRVQRSYVAYYEWQFNLIKQIFGGE